MNDVRRLLSAEILMGLGLRLPRFLPVDGLAGIGLPFFKLLYQVNENQGHQGVPRTSPPDLSALLLDAPAGRAGSVCRRASAREG